MWRVTSSPYVGGIVLAEENCMSKINFFLGTQDGMFRFNQYVKRDLIPAVGTRVSTTSVNVPDGIITSAFYDIHSDTWEAVITLTDSDLSSETVDLFERSGWYDTERDLDLTEECD